MKQKELRKGLGTWNYFKASGRVVFAVPKNAVKKIQYNYEMTKLNIKDYVKTEANAEIKARQSKVQDQIYDLYATKKEMKKDREYTHGSKKAYLAAVDEKIQKLKTKKKVIKGKGLGIFALSKLALSKYRKNWLEARAQAKEERAIEKENILKEKERLMEQQEIQEGLDRYEAMMREAEALRIENEAKMAEYENKFNASVLSQAAGPELEPELEPQHTL